MPDKPKNLKTEGGSLRTAVLAYVKKKYQTDPDYPWKRDRESAVLRHQDNHKWYGLIMNIERKKLGLSGEDIIEVINVKMDDPVFHSVLIRQNGYFPGYHMNKQSWITILLDGTVPFEDICGMIDASYKATASVKKKQKIRQPKEWIIPANPKYYDVVQAFEKAEVIGWKQGSGIKKGDTVFLYVAAPISAILFKCKVLETDIPHKYQDKNLTVKMLMKIKLQKRYKADKFTFEVLKNEYGIFAVRGPRGIPNSLSGALDRE